MSRCRPRHRRRSFHFRHATPRRYRTGEPGAAKPQYKGIDRAGQLMQTAGTKVLLSVSTFVPVSAAPAVNRVPTTVKAEYPPIAWSVGGKNERGTNVPATTPSYPGTSVPMTVSVVIPTKNEARNIGWVLERMPSYVDELIIVDGLSTDGTVDVARMIAPHVVVVNEARPGKGAAMRAGMARARSECVVVMDADGSMDPSEIALYANALADGADLAKGSRFIAGGGSTDITRLRAFGNAQLLALANALFRTNFTELCYGFMALRRSAIARLALDADGFEIETQIVTRAVRVGLRIAEVPSQEAERRYGESNLRTFRDGWRVLASMVREWRTGNTAPRTTTSLPVVSGEMEMERVEEFARQPVSLQSR